MLMPFDFAMSDVLVQAGGEADTAAGWLTASIDNPDRDRITYDNRGYYLLDMDILARLELLISNDEAGVPILKSA